MNEERARELLVSAIQPDGGLFCGGWYLAWSPNNKVNEATLDGTFTADDLEAIAWWMRNHETARANALETLRIEQR